MPGSTAKTVRFLQPTQEQTESYSSRSTTQLQDIFRSMNEIADSTCSYKPVAWMSDFFSSYRYMGRIRYSQLAAIILKMTEQKFKDKFTLLGTACVNHESACDECMAISQQVHKNISNIQSIIDTLVLQDIPETIQASVLKYRENATKTKDNTSQKTSRKPTEKKVQPAPPDDSDRDVRRRCHKQFEVFYNDPTSDMEYAYSRKAVPQDTERVIKAIQSAMEGFDAVHVHHIRGNMYELTTDGPDDDTSDEMRNLAQMGDYSDFTIRMLSGFDYMCLSS